ncbi:sugar transferase [Dehalobacter sp. TBBPA1]|uniref:sugar transferase n=1 Tax=Dehalobacter sp. TBBPA1 TaxID=3235037 RepID=UPI0034A4DB9F
MALRGMYDKTTFYYLDRILRNVIFSSLFSGLIIGSLFYFVKDSSISRLFIGIFLVHIVIIMFLQRVFFGMIYRKRKSSNRDPRLIIVCTNATWSLFLHYLERTRIRYNIIGIIQIADVESIQGITCLGNLTNLEDILIKNVVDEVILYLPQNYSGNLNEYILLCQKMGITAHLVINPYDLLLPTHVNISMLGPRPMLTFHTVTLNPIQKLLKRLMDICGALVGIFLTLFLSIFIVPAIKLDSPGPVLFKQKRVGRNGRVFEIYKFRTMCMNAEEQKQALKEQNQYQSRLMFKIKDDPRITRVGEFLRKTSLDEFPQFFNVFKGEMSLVGTRPPTLDEVSQYDTDHWRRISIKPGLTGMWQVNGRSAIEKFEDVVALDIEYIDKWSIWLDINILVQTVVKVAQVKSAF